MLNIILNILISAAAVFAAAMLVPGVGVSVTGAILAAIVIGIINAFIKPVLFILTLPINIVTLGLFSLITNALLILLAAAIVPNFDISGFWAAFLFSIVLSLINLLFGLLKQD